MRRLAWLLLLAALPVRANPIECNESSWLAEIVRLNACVNYTASGCQPPVEKCASSGTTDSGGSAPCCTGANAGTCDEGRKVTFNCDAGTTIYTATEIWDATMTGTAPNCGLTLVPGHVCEELSAASCGGSDTPPCSTADVRCISSGNPYHCCTGRDSGTCCVDHEGSCASVTYFKTNALLAAASDVVIDGENKITFAQDPACWVYISDPDGDGVDNLIDIDTNQGEFLLRVVGDDISIRNLIYTGYYNGIAVGGTDVELTNVTGIRGCDDAVETFGTHLGSSTDNGLHLLVQDSDFSLGSDKCIQMDRAAGSTGAEYDTTVLNNTFTDCDSVQFSRGRHLAQGNVWTVTTDPFVANQCITILATGGTPGLVFFQGNTCADTQFGLLVGSDSQNQSGYLYSRGGNIIENNTYTGIACEESSICFLENDIVRNNGGSSSTRNGGIYLKNTAILDAGGGTNTLDGSPDTSAGGNCITSNAGDGDALVDIFNDGSVDAKAGTSGGTANWWGANADPEAAGKFTESPGTVTASSWLAAAPATCSSSQPPGSIMGGVIF